MTDTAVVDTNTNPSQSAPPLPNSEREPVETKTPEQIAAEAAGTSEAATTEAPQIEGEEAKRGLEGPTSADADENGVITYPETGDVGMDMALEFVGKLGIGMDHPAMQATLKGDFAPIEAVLHQMGDKAKGFERFLSLAKEADAKAVAKAETSAKAIHTAVAGVLGDSQKTVLAWASKNATPDEKRSINAMLAADPVQARAAANMLLNAYQAKSGNVIQPASATKAATGDTPTQSNTRLTNVEFARETAKLARKYGGHNVHRTTEYQALVRRLG